MQHLWALVKLTVGACLIRWGFQVLPANMLIVDGMARMLVGMREELAKLDPEGGRSAG